MKLGDVGALLVAAAMGISMFMWWFVLPVVGILAMLGMLK